MSATRPEIIVTRVPDPGVYPCAACGTVGRAAVVLRATDAAPPLALCRSCGAEPARVYLVLRRAGVLPAPPTPH